MTAKEALLYISDRLQKANIEEFEYESRLLLEWIFGISRADYYMNPEQQLDETGLERLTEVLADRKRRVPLQYLMGDCEFMGYTFHVDERVLIPRQDTECLVEEALARMRDKNEPHVLDLCTGSGCIGISVKKMRPDATVTLADVSSGALAVAGTNATVLDADVMLREGDLFAAVNDTYDYILSNPPYIPSRTIETLMPEVREHEPRLALDGEADGLAYYRRIVTAAPDYLNDGGWLLFEIGMEQGESLRGLLEDRGFINIEVKRDLAGLDRIVVAQWKIQGR